MNHYFSAIACELKPETVFNLVKRHYMGDHFIDLAA
jgi:hypothetical protein